MDSAHATATRMKDEMQASAASSFTDTAKGLKASAKSMLCKGIPLKSFCKGEATGDAAAAHCTSGACCKQSSCYGGFVPGLKCNGSRGPTTCVGASMFTHGMCQCRYGPCNVQGVCPAMPGYATLFEDREPVAREVLLPEILLLGAACCTLALGGIALGRRLRRWGAGPRSARIFVDAEALTGGMPAVE